MSIFSNNADTDIVDLSGNGKGVALYLGTEAIDQYRAAQNQARELDMRDFEFKADWNGAIGTDNRQAVLDALAYAKELSTVEYFGFIPTPNLIYPPGRAYISSAAGTPIDHKVVVRSKGCGGGYARGGVLGSWLCFAPGVAGYAVQSHDTVGYTVGAVAATTSGAGCLFEDLRFQFGDGSSIGGGAAYNPALAADGLLFRAQAFAKNCQVIGAGRHGIAGLAGSDDNPYHGNCNGSLVDKSYVGYSGFDNIHWQGTDSNSVRALNTTLYNARRWGGFAGGFFAQSFFGCEADDNGQHSGPSGGIDAFSYVAYPTVNSQRYALVHGQEVAGESVVPGTNNGVWIPVYTTDGPALGGVLWFAGIKVLSGGSFYGASCLPDNYSEGGQGPAQRCGLSFGGLLGSGVDEHTLLHTGGDYGGTWHAPITVQNKTSGFGIHRTYDLCLGDNQNASDGRLFSFKSDECTDSFRFFVDGVNRGFLGFGSTIIAQFTGSAPGGGLPTYAFMPDKLHFAKGKSIQWGDSNDTILVSDNPAWYSSVGNVMTFRAYQGAWCWYDSGLNTLAASLDNLGNFDTKLTYKIGGTKVIGARQTGTVAAATDLASAIALVNDLRAKLVTHGLIS